MSKRDGIVHLLPVVILTHYQQGGACANGQAFGVAGVKKALEEGAAVVGE